LRVKNPLLVFSLLATLWVSLSLVPVASAEGDLGEKLIRQFFEDARKHDMAAIEKTLAAGFQSVHTDGVRDRASEVAIIKDIKLGSAQLTDFATTRNGSVLVVTFLAATPGEILDGKQVADGSHQRMAVWIEADSGWQLVAYANMAPLH